MAATELDTEDRLALCRAQAGLYGFLGRCLEEEVDRDLLDLVRGELRGALAEAGMPFDEAFFRADAETLLAELAEEFTTCFVAPGGVVPYWSVVETGMMYREPAQQVEEAYREAGFAYRRRLSGEFPDHIGTMLGFVAALWEAEAAALEGGDEAAAAQARARRERFMVECLGPWAVGWCRRAAEASFHVFYQQVARVAGQVIWSDLARLVDKRRLRELAALNAREPKKLDYDADFRKASGL
ncbi:TorD/DmsD family molecular chaperone [Inmirania thermothiophila]|uniref:TorA maturation chaperone TorD n=1 Tax=Inmirania thermothiophila TaxID=1750597 RepID=A0A3N1XZD7_9GAMM|nr:molecular chaperone TorD family protein [Inmirania thermothiophila]ROR31964.1 TorA maturation chaperone TorD [Inmirania thermothiophila]